MPAKTRVQSTGNLPLVLELIRNMQSSEADLYLKSHMYVPVRMHMLDALQCRSSFNSVRNYSYIVLAMFSPVLEFENDLFRWNLFCKFKFKISQFPMK